MGDVLRHFLDKKVQEWSQRQPRRQHNQSHAPVYPAVQRHEGFDRLRVSMGRRAVEAVGDGNANPQLRQREQGEDVGEKPADPQVLLSQKHHKHPAGKEFQQRQHKLADGRKLQVFRGAPKLVHLPTPSRSRAGGEPPRRPERRLCWHTAAAPPPRPFSRAGAPALST